MNKPVARIEDWERVGRRLTGKVYGHPGWPDGELVTTTEVLVNRVGSVETRNTLYQLGKRKGVTNELSE